LEHGRFGGGGVNVLSLFDGMSCGRIALERAGINVTNYYASELDKYAIQVTQSNWPKTIQLGDVTKWREWDIDWASIDLLIGGSPCQGFSFAGKQLAFDDPRSKLFFVYVDILNHIKALNPLVKFMLENVKMKKEHLAVISEQLGVEPVFINSALVSAQNRQRYYWVNWHIEQPADKGIVLADIIENDFVDREKSHCLDASYYKGGNLKSYFEKNRRQIVFMEQTARGEDKGFEKEVSKTPTLSANSWEHNNFVKCGQMVGRKINPETGKRDDYNQDLKTIQRIEIREDDKTNGLSTVQKDNLVITGAYIHGKRGLQKQSDNKAYSLVTNSNAGGKALVTDNATYRKLTVRECGRLQTVPEHIIDKMLSCGVSNTQLYKCLGNGWTIDVIAHIFSTMSVINKAREASNQASIFDILEPAA
jgi:DNA (cytosine-5)-methyltransferase 1